MSAGRAEPGPPSRSDRRLIALLGLPTLGLALSVTTVASFVPVLLEREFGAVVAGAFIAGEGLFALTIPGPVGAWSDRSGVRLPFLLIAAPLGAAALVLLPFAGPLWLLGLALAAYFLAYYVYFAPYMALYPDLVPEALRGRSQGSLGLWREIGLGGALVGGGLLLAAWRPLPFLVAAGVLLAVTAVFVVRVGPRARAVGGGSHRRADGLRDLWRQRPDVRRVLVANALWETALNALRAFGVLFLTAGLGRSASFASLVLGGVALAAVVAAPLSGVLADRIGHARLMRAALWVYALAMLGPLLTQEAWVIAVVVPGVLAAVVVMTLPYGLLMERLPDADHGAAAGLFGASRGVGLLAGPLIAGVAVQWAGTVLPETDGYAAIFGVAAAALLVSIPVLGGLGSGRPDQAGRTLRSAG